MAFVESASLRKRTQLQTVRYFYLPPIDMARFLGKGFYDVILSINNQIIFMHDETLIKKMFFDARTLLKSGGKFVLNLTNFSKYNISDDGVDLPQKESIRSKLKTSAKHSSKNGYPYHLRQKSICFSRSKTYRQFLVLSLPKPDF